MKVNEKLKYLREQKKLKQKEVAEYLKISPVAYGRYEKGTRQPANETIQKLCNFYNVGADYFFDQQIYGSNLDDEYYGELAAELNSEDFQLYQMAVSKKWEIEKAARVLIRWFGNLYYDPSNNVVEIMYIESKLKDLFAEYITIEQRISEFSDSIDVEDAILNTLNIIKNYDFKL